MASLCATLDIGGLPCAPITMIRANKGRSPCSVLLGGEVELRAPVVIKALLCRCEMAADATAELGVWERGVAAGTAAVISTLVVNPLELVKVMHARRLGCAELEGS